MTWHRGGIGPRPRSGPWSAGLLAGLVGLAAPAPAAADEGVLGPLTPERVETGGYVEGELRVFPDSPLDSAQFHLDGSFAAKPELYLEWGDFSLNMVPFVRLDAQDQNRTHADIRELLFTVRGDDWDGRIGIGKVFWGVTEGRHVVDIVNQTDLVEDPDMREKLGQPMLNLALYRDWGTLGLFLLPGFRERTFPSQEGRLRTTPRPVTDREAIYESDLEEAHVDVAARWQRTFDALDVGVSYFYGTARDPDFALGFDGATPVLIPRYDLIHQGGLELQYVFGSTLLKAESFVRAGQGDTYGAADVGFEHTLSGILGTDIDMGVLGEYLYESRECCVDGDRIFFNPLEDDFLVGLRFAFNDVDSSDALVTVAVDRESGASMLRLEASRRIGDGARLELEGGAFVNIGEEDPLFTLRRDHYLQVKLQYYF